MVAESSECVRSYPCPPHAIRSSCNGSSKFATALGLTAPAAKSFVLQSRFPELMYIHGSGQLLKKAHKTEVQVRRCIFATGPLGAEYQIVAYITEILIKLVSHLVPKISAIENTPGH